MPNPTPNPTPNQVSSRRRRPKPSRCREVATALTTATHWQREGNINHACTCSGHDRPSERVHPPTGALSRPIILLLKTLAKVTHARHRTRARLHPVSKYGLGRASPQSFFPDTTSLRPRPRPPATHVSSLARIVRADALSIRPSATTNERSLAPWLAFQLSHGII
jgi:hypothetical protein